MQVLRQRLERLREFAAQRGHGPRQPAFRGPAGRPFGQRGAWQRGGR
jgi:hypothetical protein